MFAGDKASLSLANPAKSLGAECLSAVTPFHNCPRAKSKSSVRSRQAGQPSLRAAQPLVPTSRWPGIDLAQMGLLGPGSLEAWALWTAVVAATFGLGAFC